MPNTNREYERMARAKSLAIRMLRERGVEAGTGLSLSALSDLCEVHFKPRHHRESYTDHMLRVCRNEPVGEIVPPSDFNLMTRGQIKADKLPSGNPRMDDMDSLPHQISMPWDGRGVAWRQIGAKFFGDGQ